jgi:hypothetical protein
VHFVYGVVEIIGITLMRKHRKLKHRGIHRDFVISSQSRTEAARPSPTWSMCFGQWIFTEGQIIGVLVGGSVLAVALVLAP